MYYESTFWEFSQPPFAPNPMDDLVEESAIESNTPTRFATILIDPPWPVEAGRRQVDQRSERFGKVSLDDLESFPLADLAEVAAHVYIWVPNVIKLEIFAIRMMEQAGFKLTNRIVWVKRSKTGTPILGMGPYFRPATE